MVLRYNQDRDKGMTKDKEMVLIRDIMSTKRDRRWGRPGSRNNNISALETSP